MTPEEIHEEKVEIVDDVNIVLETRIKIMSIYGDIINLCFDIVSHVITRAFRYYKRKNGGAPDGSPDRPFTEGQQDDEWSLLSKQTGFSVDELKAAANR